MANNSDAAAAADRFRCRVCGREFEDQEALEAHVRDSGLLW